MGVRPSSSSDWDLDFDLDGRAHANVVPISAAMHQRTGPRGPDTKRGLPRAVIPVESVGAGSDRPLERAPPGSVDVGAANPPKRETQPISAHLPQLGPPPSARATQQISSHFDVLAPSARETQQIPSHFDLLAPSARETQQIPSHFELRPPAPAPARRPWGLFDQIDDPQTESTLVVDSPRAVSSPYRTQRRPGHVDMNLLRARHDDPYHHSALIELGELNASSAQSWLVLAVGLVGAGVLVALFFFVP